MTMDKLMSFNCTKFENQTFHFGQPKNSKINDYYLICQLVSSSMIHDKNIQESLKPAEVRWCYLG